LTKDVISLRESRSQGSGKDSAKSTDKQQHNWLVSVLVPIALALLAIAFKLLLK
jgi:hypothetical protein